MKLEEIEKLVSILRHAKISELTISTDGTTVRLRKPLSAIAAKRLSSPPKAEAAKAERVAEGKPAPEGTYISAPMVGIFHSIDSVGARGNAVSAGQAVGVIESMKLMNDIISDQDGVIAEVLVEDGMPVEYGQNLFRLE